MVTTVNGTCFIIYDKKFTTLIYSEKFIINFYNEFAETSGFHILNVLLNKT